MRKMIMVIITVFTVITMTACTEKVDYSSFLPSKMNSYYFAETKSTKRHILYYYDSEDESSTEIAEEIILFFDGFDTLKYYTLDTSKIETETSSFGEYVDQPIIYVVSDGQPYETYTGAEEIRTFITQYSNIELDYDTFSDQHISNLSELQDIDEEVYLVYVYFEGCQYADLIKDKVLEFAFTRSIEKIYFVDLYNIEDEIPLGFEFVIDGSPQIVLMSKGEVSPEIMLGSTNVINYINELGNLPITLDSALLNYDDFENEHVFDNNQSLIISDDLHLEYYYSPVCSHCENIKQDILHFLVDNSSLEYYLFDLTRLNGNVQISGFEGTPTLYVVSNNQVVLKYEGTIEIREFFEGYQDGTIDLSEY